MRNDKSSSDSVGLLHIFIIGITLAAIAVAIFLNNKNHGETIRSATEQFNQQQLILARSAATGIETFVSDVYDDMLALSNFPVVQRMEPGILERMEVLYKGIPPQTSSRRLDKNGILRFIYPNEDWWKDLIGRNYSKDVYFKKAKEAGGKVVISGLIANEVGERRIRVARPIYIENEKGAKEFNGVIICSFDPKILDKLYISPIISGETGYAWVLNEDSIFLAHHEEEFVGRNAFTARIDTNPKLSYDGINNIQRQMMAGEEGLGRYMSGWHRGYKGKIEKLIAYTPVHIFDKVWSVAVCAPVDEIEGITRKAYRNELYSLGFIIFILTTAGIFFFITFHRWAHSLQREIEIRKQAEERIIHLNAILRAIRNVNQLIITEKDRDTLLQKTCDIVIETRGYDAAWLGFSKNDKTFAKVVGSGFSRKVSNLSEHVIDGDYSPCIRNALAQKKNLVVVDRSRECGDCFFKNAHTSKEAVIIRIKHADRLFGLLAILFAPDVTADEEEKGLLREVAGDLGFAFYNMELEEDRKRAEEALRESEEKFRAMSAAANDGIIMIDNEGKVTYWNKAAEKIFGYTDEEILGKELRSMLMPKRFHEAFETGFSKFKMTGQGAFVGKTLELAAVKKDGTEFPTELSMSAVQIGGKWNAIGLARDITKRKQAEEKLKEYSENLENMVQERTKKLRRALYDTEESRDKIDGILKSIGDGLIVTDTYNRIILMNRAAEDLLGVRFSEVIDRPIDVAIKDETLRHRFKTSLEEREPGYQFDFELPGENSKHPRIIRARTSEIKDKAGNQTGIITIIYDVTLEREVDRMKTEFLSAASHQLRTPLTSILGFSEILMTRDNIKEKQKKEFISYINTQSVNLANIINDLLDISRIESGIGFTLHKVFCNINEIIRETVKHFQASAPERQFDVILPKEPVELMVDKDKIGQVLENLLSNAVKYSPEGGSICLAAKKISETEIEISVADQGMGMSPDQVEKIFDKFYRADASDSAISGTGLGMSIVKNYVEAHGGKVWVESELGKGTVVKFVLQI